MTVGERVEALDVGLLEQIPSETTGADRRSLLALHSACRAVHGSFSYLEIGSHLGGSLQALVRDPACLGIVSIDARPPSQPDGRGKRYDYAGNSTRRMLENLEHLEGSDLAKVTALEASTQTLEPALIPIRPAFCFVDGEHTDEAALRDGRFCRRVLGDEGVIAFHDSWIVHRAVRRFIDELSAEGVPFQPYLMPDSIIAVELGPLLLRPTAPVTELIFDGYWGYLWSMEATERWREALRRPVARALARVGLLRIDHDGR